MVMAHKRRTIFAFADFQLRLVFGVLTLSVLASGYLGYRMYTLEKEKNEILQIQNESVTQLIQEFDQTLFLFVALIVLLQAVAITLLVMYLTHKVAGPISRIQRVLETAIEEKMPAQMAPVRKNDEFQDFFKVLKTYIDTFKNHP